MSQTTPVALVTGAARRVGRAIVEHLAAAGFDVVFTWHRSADAAHDLVTQIQSLGRRCIALQADLTRPQECVPAIAGAIHDLGRIHLLVNNASLYEPGDLAAFDPEQLRRAMAIHVEAPLLLCQALRPLLRQSRGHIVNMLDILAERPWPKYLAYCATKAAAWNLTLSLARELAPEVTVNGIAPGVVEWPDDFPEDQRQQYLRRVPLGRSGTPADVAELVLFLATGGSYITGQVIRLDGGRSIG